jgi:hypothetical protein
MKSALFVVSLVAMLSAFPAAAQQGPAGIPGLFGLVESVTAPTPPAPQAQTSQEKEATVDCSKAKDVAQCKASQSSSKKVAYSCKGKRGSKLKQCLQKLEQTDCSKAAEPLVCERHQKAYALCKNKIGQDHRQCLRDNLAPKK